ncbi:MAG TPA: hypothetical protein VFM16_01145, partial [Holophagaceae bacterium]|nr:hypothetical protein [Holophagaceae bacterium]
LRQADRALPKPVLEPLYRAWSQAPEGLDLPATWARLGVAAAPFDPQAPLAGLRRAWGLGSGRLEGTAP